MTLLALVPILNEQLIIQKAWKKYCLLSLLIYYKYYYHNNYSKIQLKIIVKK